MCFSVNVNLVKEELENRYGANLTDTDNYHPSYYYHAFGLPTLPAVCSESEKEIQLLKWGLIPSWIRDSRSAGEIRLKTLNARSETVDSKPSFAESFNSRRCIIPVKGFFEWQHSTGKKIPWYIYRSDDDIMSLAGLWSEWTDTSNGEIIKTFTIITTEANDLMAGIHNSKKRMPVMLEKGAEQTWLDLNTEKHGLKKLLEPYPSDLLRAHIICDLVNDKTANRNTGEVIKPFHRETGNTLF